MPARLLGTAGNPECRPALLSGEDASLEQFAQEVRRFYPSFPFVAGHALQPFAWRNHGFTPGEWVILDLCGTNHGARTWEAPERFRPERFRDWDGNPFTRIPQGGGDYHTDHRCAGEWITVELIKRAARLLTTAMRYDVPEQDLTVSLRRMPAIPRSRLVIENVRWTG